MNFGKILGSLVNPRKAAAAVSPQLIRPVRYPFGELEFQIQAAPGQPLEVQASRDLRNWEVIESKDASKGNTTFSDQLAGNHQLRFYRALSGELRSNYVGFISFDIPPGYSLIANPLRCESNAISRLFPSVPDNATLRKYNLVTYALTLNTSTAGRWSSPQEPLNPGEGALFFNPSDFPISARFVGEVPTVKQTLPIQTGTSLRGSLLPISGRLDIDLQFPIAPGDSVSLYSNHNERYLEFRYTESGWAGEAPLLRPGEGFWIAKNSPGTWEQSLK